MNMNGNKPDKSKHQKGISCAVSSCAYHDGDCYCCADKIQVGPASACTCSETVCANQSRIVRIKHELCAIRPGQ